MNQGKKNSSAPDDKKKEDTTPDRTTRIKGVVFVCIVIAIMLAILIPVGIQLLKVASDPESLEEYIEGWGALGVFVYMLLVILQILAAIVPGGPFEIAGGYLYGPLKGAIICDIAMTIGSVIVFLLSRKIGMKFVRMFFSQEKIDSVSWLHTTKKKNLALFIIFLIPGMPKDLISYVVGLTDVPLKTWVFITAVGRFPSIYLSALSGTALENRDYGMFIAVMVVLAILMIGGSIFYKIKTSKQENKVSQQTTGEEKE